MSVELRGIETLTNARFMRLDLRRLCSDVITERLPLLRICLPVFRRGTQSDGETGLHVKSGSRLFSPLLWKQ